MAQKFTLGRLESWIRKLLPTNIVGNISFHRDISGVCIFPSWRSLLPSFSSPKLSTITFCLQRAQCWCTGRQFTSVIVLHPRSSSRKRESKSKRESDREGKKENVSFACASWDTDCTEWGGEFYPLESFPRLLLPKCNSLGVRA